MDFFHTFIMRAEKFSPEITVSDCRDPDDNKFLELALSANADCIITGDKDLLELAPYKGIKILSANDFLESFA